MGKRVLVCGDRKWSRPDMVFDVLLMDLLGPGDVVIEGCAKGADAAAEWAAGLLGATVEHYPAFWDQHGKLAGPLRNTRMVLVGKPDVVYAFHEYINKSRGTAHMVRFAKSRGIPVKLFTHDHPEGTDL